ncbi:TetR/AcrR family transcriptional regulator [Solihabitans fulvus]|uniref:TetR/AcrR family transcriptional regulator n=1 Tax=Solihabitans fulvus TaxID=1892852 RepID=A0A5B2XBG0_9PSEU|nr:TetR/AcrR family transcriptional regulator [Solihabitans fulvus]KAA2260977.1 TetR/AcrR family transcriptional regulator [Solihabitans fulvus]
MHTPVPDAAAQAHSTVPKLPPGRHGLSRTAVADNQRERALAAVADTVERAGYLGLTVEAIIGHAGLSRRTFYEHFHNREDAFLAAYDAATAELTDRIRTAYESEHGFADRLHAGLAALLTFLAARPGLARLCVVEPFAAGPAALARHDTAMRVFAGMIEENIRELLPDCHSPSLTAETIVGGIYQVIYARISRQETTRLPELLPGLLCSLLRPYLGAEAEAQCRRMTGALPPADGAR